MPLRAAIIRNGRVKNVIMLADNWDDPKAGKDYFKPSGNDIVVISDEAQMYDHYDGVKFTRGEKPTPPPPSRASELAAKPTLTAAEVQEALKLLLERRR